MRVLNLKSWGRGFNSRSDHVAWVVSRSTPFNSSVMLVNIQLVWLQDAYFVESIIVFCSSLLTARAWQLCPSSFSVHAPHSNGRITRNKNKEYRYNQDTYNCSTDRWQLSWQGVAWGNVLVLKKIILRILFDFTLLVYTLFYKSIALLAVVEYSYFSADFG